MGILSIDSRFENKLLQTARAHAEQNRDSLSREIYSEAESIYDINYFIDMLKNKMSSVLSANAYESICERNNIEYDMSVSNGSYHFMVYFDNPHRESLLQEEYPDGIKHIAELLDTGAGLKSPMKKVSGYWKGRKIDSRTVIPRGNYIDSTAEEMRAYYKLKGIDAVINIWRHGHD